MGSWNATCGISQLPILAGEKIRVFVLKPVLHRERSPNMMCYPTDNYRTLGIPFIAEYNDYGSVTNIEENYNTKIIHDELSKLAVLPKDKPFTIGDAVAYIKEPSHDDDQYHSNYFEVVDISDENILIRDRHSANKDVISVPVSNLKHDNGEGYYDDFGDLGQIIDLTERGVFEISGCAYFNSKLLAVPGLFYVRENIWQALIADIEEESEYKWGHKSRDTMLKQIDDFLVELKETVDAVEEKNKTPEDAAVAAFRMMHGMITMGGEENRIGRLFESSSDTFSATLYREPMLDAIRNDDIKLAKSILIDAYDTSSFMLTMMCLRKSLAPQCGAGSQSVGIDYHTALVDAITTEIKAIGTHWDE